MATGRRRWTLLVAVVGVALAGALSLAVERAQPSAARDSCPDQATPSRQLSQAEARRAIKCLINRKRGGRRELVLRRDLNRPAKRHSGVMARNHCLRHACPGEPATLRQRIRGYLRGASKFRFSESIAVNAASTTPKEIVRQWMTSSVHRGILLGRWKHLGVGVVTADGLSWYTAIFGFRRG